ncbi:hypothetical protein D3C87_752670 [compost metagenome]
MKALNRKLFPIRKLFLLSTFSCLTLLAAKAQKPQVSTNFALHLDGADNNPCIGMPIMEKAWTIEAWIKGNDLSWKKIETIIGVGEYGNLNGLDEMPLQIREGKLHCPAAKLTSTKVLDDKWHYVALSNNGTETKLYQDGKLMGTSKGKMAFLPGTIGVYDKAENTFGGLIDEVRIWNTAIPQQVLQLWASKPLTARHPNFKNLKAYYNFDDLKDDVCLNLVGKGHQAYHLRNTRLNYKGNLPLAYLVANDNGQFVAAAKNQEVFNAVAIASEWDAEQGAKNNQLLKLRIAINGTEQPLKLTELSLNLEGTTRLTDVERVHVYYAGKSARDGLRTELFGNGKVAAKKLSFTTVKPFVLKSGINYFLIALDIQQNAVVSDTLKAAISGFTLNGKKYQPEAENSNIAKTIVPAQGKENALKLLQWNIWHGGVHMGNNGKNRVKELIRSTSADIICMQEAYGTQQMLADSLNFKMITASANANLALFSRYPITKLTAKEPFKSTPGIITLPNARQILVADWWLRYAYRPEYTDYYLNKGLDVNDWIKEDAMLGAADATVNMDTDIDPVVKGTDMAVIVSGDFNSGSHLDWTARAAPLHNGYGPVAFPISKLMLDRGYTDTYRAINPNELSHPAGTFAAIFGHLQTSRIDYIYYKGTGIKPIASKIIRTAPEIDDVWPSDHAAVLTAFDLSK